MRSITITHKDGAVTKVSGIPDDSKITFGSMAPGSRGMYNGEGTLALRIYAGKDKENQLAVFANVLEFKDDALTFQRTDPPPKSTQKGGKNPF